MDYSIRILVQNIRKLLLILLLLEITISSILIYKYSFWVGFKFTIIFIFHLIILISFLMEENDFITYMIFYDKEFCNKYCIEKEMNNNEYKNDKCKMCNKHKKSKNATKMDYIESFLEKVFFLFQLILFNKFLKNLLKGVFNFFKIKIVVSNSFYKEDFNMRLAMLVGVFLFLSFIHSYGMIYVSIYFLLILSIFNNTAITEKEFCIEYIKENKEICKNICK